MNDHEHDHDDVLMTELLLLADRREIQPPRELLDGVAAKLQERTRRASSTMPARTMAARPRRVWWASAAAAVIVLTVCAWFLRPSGVAWTQVVQAVRAVPWIHIKAHDEAGHATESWLSFSQNRGAMRADDVVQYDDFRSGVRYQYDRPAQKLYRLSVNGEWTFNAAQGLFQAIFRGDPVLGEDLVGPRIVKQQRREVTEQGRRWILYELEVENAPKSIPPDNTTVIFRVNPEKMLPEAATIDQGKKTATMDFDYPTEGPADIYALGVPRNAAVEDRMPAPDLARILKTVEENRRKFDDYLAVAGEDRNLDLNMVRCKGDQWRVDIGLAEGLHLASEADLEKWWQAHRENFTTDAYSLCDGVRVYSRELGVPGATWRPTGNHVTQGDGREAANGATSGSRFFVELLAYTPSLSSLASSPRFTTRLDPSGADGPPGSVRIEVRIADTGAPSDRATFHKEEFWLQAKYGYAVVKSVYSDCPQVDADPKRKEKRVIEEYDGYRQTPRGLWYPTVSRLKHASWTEIKDVPGGVEFHDQVTYFFLDFKAELPDELFRAGAPGGGAGLPATRP